MIQFKTPTKPVLDIVHVNQTSIKLKLKAECKLLYRNFYFDEIESRLEDACDKITFFVFEKNGVAKNLFFIKCKIKLCKPF